MAEPTWKAPEIEVFLEEKYGRTTKIKNNKCVFCPRDVDITKLKPLELQEYRISGICEHCQLEIFGGD